MRGLFWQRGGRQLGAAPGSGREQLTREGDLLEKAAGRDIFPAGAGIANAETHALGELDVLPSLEKRCLLSSLPGPACAASLPDLETIIFSCFSSLDL